MEREYIVSLNPNIEYDEFWNEIENLSVDDGFVPSRRVDIVNNRDGSLRSCHYSLTDEEANLLRKDPRVFSVEIPPDQRSDIVIGKRASQSGDFTKTTSNSGSFINYGLRRCISATNPYGTGTTVSGDFTYPVDGTGVDIVIQDSGLQVDHPEFFNASGVTRVQQINWYTASGLSGTQSPNHYRDFDGHGTHVAGIAAGITYGWAKGANIYSVKVNGLEGSGDSGTGISVTDCFDVIKLWHRNKPIDPVTGVKRPTIVNMSWGYFSTFTNINGGVYRGSPWTGSMRRTDFGMIGANDGSGIFNFDVRVGSVDSDVQELIDEGVHVCIAAGNSFQKIDTPSGLDYNNYFLNVSTPVYYHRGGSPNSSNAIVVGSTDSTVFDSAREQKSIFSNCGPGVDLYAPGSNIMSCTSNTVTGFTTAPYFRNSSFRQMNISGTSMAAPQVCGYGAALLQTNPRLTPTQLKSRIIENSQSTMYTTGFDNDYTNNRSISNGTNRFMYQPFNGSQPYVISGGITITNASLRI